MQYLSLEAGSDYVTISNTADGSTYTDIYSSDSNVGTLASPAIVDSIIPAGQISFMSNAQNNFDGFYMTYSIQAVNVPPKTKIPTNVFLRQRSIFYWRCTSCSDGTVSSQCRSSYSATESPCLANEITVCFGTLLFEIYILLILGHFAHSIRDKSKCLQQQTVRLPDRNGFVQRQ